MKKTKKNILVGVTGGIASYKTCELVRLFVKDGFSVKVMMTESAVKFVSPLVFQNLSGNPVYTQMFQTLNTDNIQHISLSQWADLCVVAPLSANTLSKIANGICDNFLTTVICALNSKTKALFVPAMNENMWKNPIIPGNVKKMITISKYTILNPQTGDLACGVSGEGRMPDPEDIFKQAKLSIK